jgi:hypothetical protein
VGMLDRLSKMLGGGVEVGRLNRTLDGAPIIGMLGTQRRGMIIGEDRMETWGLWVWYLTGRGGVALSAESRSEIEVYILDHGDKLRKLLRRVIKIDA